MRLRLTRWVVSHGHAIRRLRIDLKGDVPSNGDVNFYRGGAGVLLSHVPHLQELQIANVRSFFDLSHNLYVMTRLTTLCSLKLSLRVEDQWPADMLNPLKDLTALTSLDLAVRDLYGPLRVSNELSKLTQLKVLSLKATAVDDNYDDEYRSNNVATDQGHLVPTLSQLTSLTELTLAGMLDSIPAQLSELSQIVRLSLCNFSRNRPALIIPASLSLCSKLEHLVLEKLSETSVQSWWGICQSLACLPSLNALSIAGVDLSDMQGDSWILPSQLTFLSLDYCQMSAVPLAVQHLASLQCLQLVRMPLKTVNCGTYLKELRHLFVHCTCTMDGPEALHDAAALREVTILQEERLVLSGRCSRWTEDLLKSIVPADCSIVFLQELSAKAETII